MYIIHGKATTTFKLCCLFCYWNRVNIIHMDRRAQWVGCLTCRSVVCSNPIKGSHYFPEHKIHPPCLVLVGSRKVFECDKFTIKLKPNAKKSSWKHTCTVLPEVERSCPLVTLHKNTTQHARTVKLKTCSSSKM